jgi:A/G-specific adenine glycosylase
MHQDQSIYLERRPPSGIWGGLWSFPQFEDADSARNWLEKQGLDRSELETGTPLPEYKHTFSHYRLIIQAIMISPQKPDTGSVMETDGSIWYNINDEFDGGLATPVQDLLKTFKEKTL